MAYEQAKEQAMKAGICVADIVKVIKYDESKMIVDVQPLTNTRMKKSSRGSHRYCLCQ